MVPDALPPPSLPRQPQPFTKVRFRFRKGADLRLLSHHDLLRTFERLLRRANLPVRQTQGFHPKPRLVFALSLPLGVVGCEEVGELELTEPLPPDAVHVRLAAQAPPGIDILSVAAVDPHRTAQVRTLTYRLAVPPERLPGLAEKVAAVLAAPECWVERKRPPARRLDLRPILSDLRLVPASGGREAPDGTNQGAYAPRSPGVALEMELFLTPAGTARPDEVLGLLGLADLLTEGVVLERSRLELHEDTPQQPPQGPPE